ncbi:hypothetical protein JL721_13158 [Aureococcus anophagefferens]|nr:hypothetical protein JL721_13158 [Aureococcus anophagefferens]
MTDDARHALLKADALFRPATSTAPRRPTTPSTSRRNEVEVVFQAFNNRGALMVRRGRAAEAIANFESAVAVDDSDGDAAVQPRGRARATRPLRGRGRLRPLPRARADLRRRRRPRGGPRGPGATRGPLPPPPPRRAGDARATWPSATRGSARATRPRGGGAPRRGGRRRRLATTALFRRGAPTLTCWRGDLSGALALYRSALAGGGDAAARNYALLLQRSGDGAGAVAELRASSRAEPDHAAAHNALGLALLQRGDAAGAEPHLAKTSDLAPGDSERSYNVGVCLLKRATRRR